VFTIIWSRKEEEGEERGARGLRREKGKEETEKTIDSRVRRRKIIQTFFF
jgi:hypothetical protein